MTTLERTLREAGVTVWSCDEEPELFAQILLPIVRTRRHALRPRCTACTGAAGAARSARTSGPRSGCSSSMVSCSEHEREWRRSRTASGGHVLETPRIAVLDQRATPAACQWPQVLSALLGRAVQQGRSLALQFAIADLRRVDDRLPAAFWQFADRWDTAGPAASPFRFP